jgi:tetratricopeptide (TPR) repeat protein
MSELDVYGALAGTDKSSSVSWGWDYLRHYEALFAPWRHQAINVIEIGVAGGASLEMWHRYFTKATLVGVDINPDCRRFERDRVVIWIGSQDDPGFLHNLSGVLPPSIVIDDGSHIAHDMIASFEVLFPALLPGGVYVFEDLAFHFEDSEDGFRDSKAAQGHAEMPIVEYLQRFVRGRAANLASPRGARGFARYAYENIDSIAVAGGMIAVHKRAPRDIETAAAVFERELVAPGQNRAAAGLRYAEYLVRHNVRLERAAALLADILAADPANESALNQIVAVMMRLGRWDEAAEAATRLVRRAGDHPAYWEQLAEIEQHRGRPDLQATALRRLTELHPGSAGHHHRYSEACQDSGDLPTALAAAKRARELDPANQSIAARVAMLEQHAR